jgi:probable rRNA maturation factor
LVILRKRTAGLSEPVLERFVARAKRAVRLRGTVNVLVTTSRELRILNSRFRGLDKATDVLSFPPIFGLIPDFAGDVAISADIAAQNARRLGHSAAIEIKILALHGVLHLAGYDHERDAGEMGRREAALRKKLGLPVALIARDLEDSARNSLTAKYAKVARRPQRKAKATTARKSAGSRGRSRRSR